MSTSARARRLATVADLMALPEASRFHEVIAGDLVQKAAPSGEHGAAQAALAGCLFGPFSRPTGGRWPGGWWFETEVEVEFEGHEVTEAKNGWEALNLLKQRDCDLVLLKPALSTCTFSWLVL